MQGIPEFTGIIALSLVLAGVELRWVRIILAATILAIIIFVIRALPLPFGLHTIIALLLLVLLITKSTYTPTAKSLVIAFASFGALALLEIGINEGFFAVTKLKQDVLDNYLLWKLLGLPQGLLLIILALLTRKYARPVKGAWKF